MVWRDPHVKVMARPSASSYGEVLCEYLAIKQCELSTALNPKCVTALNPKRSGKISPP